MGQPAFLVGFAIMALASLAIYATGNKHGPARHHTLLHATVPFVAATAYLAMAMGLGTVIAPNGAATYIARYLDWSVTTPILLAGLVLVALHERDRAGNAGGYLTAIITLDVLMIVAGLVSSLAPVPIIKWIWYGWSCAAFLGVLYLLWVPLRAEADPARSPLGRAYASNAAFLTVVWFLYPIVFLVGPEGLRMISDAASVWTILVLDVIAKVAYAFVAGRNVDAALARSGRA